MEISPAQNAWVQLIDNSGPRIGKTMMHHCHHGPDLEKVPGKWTVCANF